MTAQAGSDVPTETDVVVMGGGAGGLAAAVAAREAGARVVVLEKQRTTGGTGNFIQGLFAVGSDMQKREYIAYTCDQAFHNFMEYNHWRGNAALAKTLIDRSAENVSWLQQRGVEFGGITINMPDAPRTYHVIRGQGRTLTRALARVAKGLGVEIRTGSPVLEILKADDGLPCGVRTKVAGRQVEIGCGAVIIATGGYANNKDWIKKYAGFDLGENLWPVGNTGKMGDGIRLAWEMGAAAESMGVLHLLRVAPWGREFPFMSPVEAMCIQPILWVDPQGRRFCDETIAFYDTSTGNVNCRFKAGYTWSVFDDNLKRHFMERGVDKGMGQALLPGLPIPDLEDVLQRFAALGSSGFVTADSVEGLAAEMEVDPGILTATVAQYNEACAQGRDPLFGKDPALLRPLTGPRYYAARARTAFLGSLGGIRVSAETEVVDEWDHALPGLYAAGNDVGGLHTESYSMRDTSGIASAFAVISGRIAGERAAAYATGTKS